MKSYFRLFRRGFTIIDFVFNGFTVANHSASDATAAYMYVSSM